jgi:branched-chain amino acid transport system substrate-binding protein
MSQKNETTLLVLTVLITLGLFGGGALLLKDKIFPPRTSASITKNLTNS